MELTPEIPAGSDGDVALRLRVVRQVETEPPEARDLADGVNGVVDLPRLSRTDVRADLVLRPGVPEELQAGALPDGRPVNLRVRILP